MSAIDFQVNEFYNYEVQVEGLSLGFINTTTGAYTPARGEILQYDGSTVILKDGREFSNVPQLRTAIIESNWLARVGEEAKKPRAKSANIQVRPTETRANQKVVRSTVVIHQSDEREVLSVAARKAARENTNAEATRRVPLESQEARDAITRHEAPLELVGDDDVDGLLLEMEDELTEFFETGAEPLEELDDVEDWKAEVDEDLISVFAWAEEDTPAPAPAPEAAKPFSARRLPVDAQDDRKTMPLVREDPTVNSGKVVGNVGDQGRTIIEREKQIAMNVARATPESKPVAPRRGITGAIIVDEQRDMGQISLSSTAAPIRLDESAKVVSGSRESIKMGDGAQVGTRRKTAGAAPPVTVDGGVAVGRVLSPTKTSFVATDANTSSTAIDNAQKGKRLRVERFETDEVVVGNVSEGAKARAVATGDVQEAIVGDTLEEVLPDAATSPKPEVYRRPENDPAFAAVKVMIPDFEWNRDLPLKVKAKAALKHIENPMYIKGILAVESELAQTEIKKEIAAELQRRKKAKKAKKAKKEAE